MLFNTENIALSANSSSKKIIQLDTNLFLYSYFYSSGYVTFKAFTLSDGVATFGSASSITASQTYDVIAISTTQALLVFTHASTLLMGAVVITVNPTTRAISWGSAAYFTSIWSIKPCIGKLSSDTFFVFFEERESVVGSSCILTVSGTTITYGSTYSISSTSFTPSGCVVLDSTHIIIAYHNDTDYIGYARLATISGTAISYGSALTIGSPITYTDPNVPCTHLFINSTTAILFFPSTGAGGNSQLLAVKVNYSGTTVSVINTTNIMTVNSVTGFFTNQYATGIYLFTLTYGNNNIYYLWLTLDGSNNLITPTIHSILGTYTVSQYGHFFMLTSNLSGLFCYNNNSSNSIICEVFPKPIISAQQSGATIEVSW